MKIHVRVKTHSRKESVEVRGDGGLIVSVNAPATEGRANERVIEVLSRYLKKPKRALRIVFGLRSKNKVIEVSE